MTEHHHTALLAGQSLDVARRSFGYSTQPLGVVDCCVFFIHRLAHRSPCTFSNNDDGKVPALLLSLDNLDSSLFDEKRNLGDKYDIGPPSHSGLQRDPPDVP